MDATTASQAAPRRSLRSRARLYEMPDGRLGPGRLVERWLCLWRWETWARDSALERRPRAGWALTYKGALVSSQDALDDYELTGDGTAPEPTLQP